MRLEQDRLHVGLVDDHVDDAELGVREFAGDLVERRRPGEADGHDRRETVLGEFAQGLLALGVVLDFEIAKVDAGVLLEFFRAVEDAFIEGFVELAAEVVDHGGLDVGGEDRRRSEQRRGEARKHSRQLTAGHANLPLFISTGLTVGARRCDRRMNGGTPCSGKIS